MICGQTKALSKTSDTMIAKVKYWSNWLRATREKPSANVIGHLNDLVLWRSNLALTTPME